MATITIFFTNTYGRYIKRMSMDIEIFDGTLVDKFELKLPLVDATDALCNVSLASTCKNLSEKGIIAVNVLEEILKELTELTLSDFGIICYYDVKSSKILKNLCYHERIEDSLNKSNDINDILSYVATNHVTVLSNNIAKDPRFGKTSTFAPKSFLGISINLHTFLVLGCLKNPKGYDIIEIRRIIPFLKYILPLADDALSKIKDTDTHRITKTSSNDELKDKFLAAMSHEIRTPLNGIMGMVTMLSDAGPLNQKQQTYVKTLTECVLHLSNLMNNILDFSKMTSNRFYLLKQPFSIFDAIEDAFKMVEGSALIKGLTLNKKLPNSYAIPKLIGDSQRITQILSNLLGNSVKFTEKGSVTLSVDCVEILDKHNDSASPFVKKVKISFEVCDTGVGVPMDEQQRIFDMFHQSSNLTTYMSSAGTGLGLSISRELVKLMGGNIVVKSEGINGKGSVFSFSIVLEVEISTYSLSSETLKVIKNTRILAVDDRPEIRLQLLEMLSKWGCIPFIAPGAEEGLKYIRCGMKFDAIIIDMCMPYMSGTELAQELRRIVPNIPLIGISSINVDAGEKLFDVFMYKPITQNALFPALLRCLNKKSAKLSVNTNSLIMNDTDKVVDNVDKVLDDANIRVTDDANISGERYTENHESTRKKVERRALSTPHEKLRRTDVKSVGNNTLRKSIKSTSKNFETTKEKIGHDDRTTSHKKKTPKTLKILVAEDEKNNAFTIMEMLNNLGFGCCEQVGDGKACIDKVKSEKWDAVLMDIRMPIMDGIEATRHIRAMPEPPYIVAISASVLNSDKERCQTVGINAYLPKPITKEELYTVLEPLLKSRYTKKYTKKYV